METINKFGSRIVLIVDEKECFIGIATDGDIRRSFLAGHNSEEAISAIINKTPVVAHENTNRAEMVRMLSDKYKEIPIIDEKKKIIGLLTLEDKDIFLDIKLFYNLCRFLNSYPSIGKGNLFSFQVYFPKLIANCVCIFKIFFHKGILNLILD